MAVVRHLESNDIGKLSPGPGEVGLDVLSIAEVEDQLDAVFRVMGTMASES